jgi:predicted polyphosphate/ATP-dependent NAD kinase
MRIGLIVNPIAGMGGKVGLKGTDGKIQEAFAKGAQPVAPQRATDFLRELKHRLGETKVEVLCAAGQMGTQEAQAAGISYQTLPMTVEEETSASDTQTAVKLLNQAKVDVIVFVGGDGTARNILDAVKETESAMPVVGVPAGVKMYSGIFAINPTDAAEAVTAFLQNRAEVADFEIMDADENAIRNDVFDVKLYGYLKGVSVPLLIQGSKDVSIATVSEKRSQTLIADYVVAELPKDATLKKTVLGVDIYQNNEVVSDVDEKIILQTVTDWQHTWLILSPIGHQGILLGRGNQQISPQIIKRIGKSHILVVATLHKLQGIEALRVDTGDAEVDALLKGELLVVTGYREGVTVPVH